MRIWTIFININKLLAGLYIPLLWEQSFCIKSPIALGYTRGHFSALVPTEPYARIDAARVDSEDVTFLPLMDCEHKLLPIHFLNHTEVCSIYAHINSFSFNWIPLTDWLWGVDNASMVGRVRDRRWPSGSPAKIAETSVARGPNARGMAQSLPTYCVRLFFFLF